MDRNDKGQGVTGHRIDLYWSPRRNIRGRQFCHVIGLFGISAECVPYIVANFFLTRKYWFSHSHTSPNPRVPDYLRKLTVRNLTYLVLLNNRHDMRSCFDTKYAALCN